MSNIQVSLVPKEHIKTVWDKVEGYIEQAASQTGGRYDMDDVLDMIMTDKYSLWVAFDPWELKGGTVTCITQYPGKKTLTAMFLGGTEGYAWKKAMLATLQKYARDLDCEAIEATGRMGWTKIFKDDGIKPLWQTFELPVATGGASAPPSLEA